MGCIAVDPSRTPGAWPHLQIMLILARRKDCQPPAQGWRSPGIMTDAQTTEIRCPGGNGCYEGRPAWHYILLRSLPFSDPAPPQGPPLNFQEFPKPNHRVVFCQNMGRSFEKEWRAEEKLNHFLDIVGNGGGCDQR